MGGSDSALKDAGFSGVDLAIRPGGTMEPAVAAEELPRLADFLREHGLDISMISTDITNVAGAYAREVFATAAKLKIRYVKLGYSRYCGFGSLAQLRAQVKAELLPLAELLGEFGLVGGYHNHSADFFGASLWDIHEVIAGVDPQRIGLYFDPAHATIEGGSSGWNMGMDLLRDRIVMLAVKDFRWLMGKEGYAGALRHSVEFCPLEKGNVEWRTVIGQLLATNFRGPVSLHGEYQGPHSFADLSCRAVIEQSKQDLSYFRRVISEAKASVGCGKE